DGHVEDGAEVEDRGPLSGLLLERRHDELGAHLGGGDDGGIVFGHGDSLLDDDVGEQHLGDLYIGLLLQIREDLLLGRVALRAVDQVARRQAREVVRHDRADGRVLGQGGGGAVGRGRRSARAQQQRDRHLAVVLAAQVDDELGRERKERALDLGRGGLGGLGGEDEEIGAAAAGGEQQEHGQDDLELAFHGVVPPEDWVALERMTTMSTRRLSARPWGVVLGATGFWSAYPTAARWLSATPWWIRNSRTAVAREVESSQLLGNSLLAIGTSSVLPSTLIGFWMLIETMRRATRPSSGNAVAFRVASPLSNTRLLVSRRMTSPRWSMLVEMSFAKPCLRA